MPQKDTKKRVISGLDMFRKEGMTYQELKLQNPGTAIEYDDDLDEEGHLILKK